MSGACEEEKPRSSIQAAIKQTNKHNTIEIKRIHLKSKNFSMRSQRELHRRAELRSWTRLKTQNGLDSISLRIFHINSNSLLSSLSSLSLSLVRNVNFVVSLTLFFRLELIPRTIKSQTYIVWVESIRQERQRFMRAYVVSERETRKEIGNFH